MNAHHNPEARAFIREKIAQFQDGPYVCGLSGQLYDTLPDPVCEACPVWDGDGDVEVRALSLGWQPGVKGDR